MGRLTLRYGRHIADEWEVHGVLRHQDFGSRPRSVGHRSWETWRAANMGGTHRPHCPSTLAGVLAVPACQTSDSIRQRGRLDHVDKAQGWLSSAYTPGSWILFGPGSGTVEARHRDSYSWHFKYHLRRAESQMGQKQDLRDANVSCKGQRSSPESQRSRVVEDTRIRSPHAVARLAKCAVWWGY